MAEPITITLRNTARSYLEILFHRKWLLIIPVIFITLFAWGYSHTLTPMYRSTAVIEVREKAKENPYLERFSKSTPITARLPAILRRVRSRSLIEDVIRELRLHEAARTDAEYRELVRFVRRNLGVTMTGGTRRQRTALLEVTMAHPDPVVAQQVVNLVTRNVIKENLELQDQETMIGIEWIEKELDLYRQKMEETDAKMKAFQERYAGLLPEEMAAELYTSLTYIPTTGARPVAPPFPREFLRQSTYGSRYQRFSEVLLNQGVRFKELQRRRDTVLRQLEEEPEFVVSSRVTETNPVIQSLRQDMTQKQVRLARLMVDSTEEHPMVKRLMDEIAALNETIETGGTMTLKEETTSINPIWQAARMELEDVEREIESLEEAIEINRTIAQTAFERMKKLPEIQQEMANLQRELASHERTFSQLLSQRDMALVTRRMDLEERGTQFLIVDNARVAHTPFSPNRKVLVMAGFFMGLVFGGGLIVLAEITDHSFEEANQLREFLPIPMLGAISQILTPDEKAFMNAKKRLWLLTLLVVVTFIILTVVVFMIFG